MPITDTICACDFEEDYSSPEQDCGEDECGNSDGCGDPCGVESCAVVVCKANVLSTVKADCNAAESAGQITGIDTGESKGVRFFANDETLLPESEETVDEDGICAISENISGQGKTGPANLCWMRKYKSKAVYLFAVDGCDRVRMYDVKLTQFKETPGQKTGDFCGIEFTFTNTKNPGFCFVDYAAMGFATPDEFMESLLP